MAESTKFVFRSQAARIFWLVQMSKEMWDCHVPESVGIRKNRSSGVPWVWDPKLLQLVAEA